VISALGHPVADTAELPPLPVELPRCRRGEPIIPQLPAPRSRTAHVALTVAALAVLLAVTALVAPSGGGVGQGVVDIPPPGLTGYAELYVATWLTAGGEDGALDPFLPAAVDLAAMEPGRRYVTRSVAVEAVRDTERLWSVTVAADVLDLVDGAYLPAGVEHYRVGIAVDGSHLSAISLPARVAAPEPARLPSSLPALEEPVPDALLATTHGFLAALLTGDGDPDRFTAPGAGIVPILPSPYTDVTIAAAAGRTDGAEMVLQITVHATAAAGHIHVMQYTLRASDNSGVWEILAIGSMTAREGRS